MDAAALSYRRSVVEHVRLLASAEAQLKYETDVPMADVPAELLDGFLTNLFDPESLLASFTRDEFKSLAELYGRLCVAHDAFKRERAHSMRDLLKVPEWRSLMTFAKRLAVELERGG